MSARKLTEFPVEKAALAWLESLGYVGKHSSEIAPGELGAEHITGRCV